MLPHVIKSLTAATLLATTMSSSPAQAWGKSEQDVLAGVLGTLAIQALIRHDTAHRTQNVAPAPKHHVPVTYVDPAPQTVSVYRTPTAQAFNAYSLTERKRIQRSLRANGYYYGGPDGAFGPRTYSAIVAFAQDSGLSANLNSTQGAFGVLDALIY